MHNFVPLNIAVFSSQSTHVMYRRDYPERKIADFTRPDLDFACQKIAARLVLTQLGPLIETMNKPITSQVEPSQSQLRLRVMRQTRWPIGIHSFDASLSHIVTTLCREGQPYSTLAVHTYCRRLRVNTRAAGLVLDSKSEIQDILGKAFHIRQ